MDQIGERIKRWQKEHYPIHNRAATYRKLLEEVGELGEALIDKDLGQAVEEAADVAILLFGLVERLGLCSMREAIEWKLDIIEKRPIPLARQKEGR